MLEKDRALLRNIVLVMLLAVAGLAVIGIVSGRKWTQSLASDARDTPPVASSEPAPPASATITSAERPILPRVIEGPAFAAPQKEPTPPPPPEESAAPPPPIAEAPASVSPGMLNPLDSGLPFVRAPYVPPASDWEPPAGWTFVPPQELLSDGGLTSPR